MRTETSPLVGNIFQILLLAIFMFLLNIWLYYTSENYRWFLQNIKWEKIIENINDEYKIKEEEIEKTLEEELNEKVINNKKETNLEFNSKGSLIEKINFVQKKVDKDIEMSKYSKEFLNIFYNKFGKKVFTNLKEHSSLMDVTSEYPDKYFEFYSPNLTLYFFPTKNYNEVKEIFEIESDWELFIINEVDNFWEDSFYINLWEGYRDDFIRIILSKKDSVIWIKVSKSEYNSIKNIIK